MTRGLCLSASLSFLVLVLVCAIVAAAAAKPQRIVSLNLCADQLVLMLAERERIASITFVSLEPDSSYMAVAARGLRINHGRAEEILPLRPDLVLAGVYSTRTTVGLLRRFGFPVVELDVPSDFAGVAAQVREVAALLGEQARGEALIGRMEAKLAAARAMQPRRGAARPLAALYMPDGFTAGSGTLNDLVLQAAGYRNLAVELGISGGAEMPLESLLTGDPDLLIHSGFGYGTPSQAEAVLRHPALRQAMRRKPTVHVPAHLWICAGPMLADAALLLAEAAP